MIEKKGIIYFDSDAEFEDWAVAPYATIKYKKNRNIPYTSGDLSNEHPPHIIAMYWYN